MCPTTPRKGKRFYDDELASGGKCGAGAARFNPGQAVASTYGINAGVDVDGTGNDPQTSPGVGTFGIDHGLDTDSIHNQFGVDLSFLTAGKVAGHLLSLDNPTIPVVVSQLPAIEARAMKSIFPPHLPLYSLAGLPATR